MPNPTDDGYTQMSDEEILAEYDSLIAEVEAGEIEATPEQLVELRDKREAFVQSVHNEKIAHRDLAIAKARTQTALARLLKLFDAECNPNNETGH